MRRLLPVAAAAAALPTLLVASALAVAPERGATYAAKAPGGLDVTLRVSTNGRAIPSYALYFPYHCKDGSSGPTGLGRGKGFSRGLPPIKVTSHGSFAISHKTVGQGQTVTFDIHGHFAGADRHASGKVHEHIRNGNGLSCDSGRLTFRAFARTTHKSSAAPPCRVVARSPVHTGGAPGKTAATMGLTCTASHSRATAFVQSQELIRGRWIHQATRTLTLFGVKARRHYKATTPPIDCSPGPYRTIASVKVGTRTIRARSKSVAIAC